MRIEKLKQYEGQVLVLDLISNKEITARIKSVDIDSDVVVCSKPRIFIPIPNPNVQNDTQVLCMEYGQPLYKSEEELEIDTNHIFTIFKPSKEHINAYQKNTSSIIPASSNVLDILKQ